MSYDIELRHPTTCEVLHAEHKHGMAGGTYCVGGTTELSLNVTYNYAGHFNKALGPGGVRAIYGLTGLQSMPVLAAGIAKLGTDVHPDYWQATQGNARAALLNLVALACLGPEGVWHGD
jgi:hypothetical protein